MVSGLVLLCYRCLSPHPPSALWGRQERWVGWQPHLCSSSAPCTSGGSHTGRRALGSCGTCRCISWGVPQGTTPTPRIIRDRPYTISFPDCVCVPVLIAAGQLVCSTVCQQSLDQQKLFGDTSKSLCHTV